MNGQTKNSKRVIFQTGAKALCLVLALLLTVCLLPPMRGYAEIPDDYGFGGIGGYIAEGNTTRWSLYVDGRLVIEVTGTTAMPELGYGEYPWQNYKGEDYSSDIIEIEIKSNITSVSGSAFKGCENLESVTIADTVKSIGDSAFNGCGIETVDIPEGVETIGPYAFAYCEYLDEAHIPSTVTFIQAGAFYCDSALSDVYYNGSEEEWEALEANISDTGNAPLLEDADIHYMAGKCGDNLTWSLNDGTLTISGEGDMYNYNFPTSTTPVPWLDYRGSITKVVIGEGATSIGAYAFSECSALTDVSIPSTVTSFTGGYHFNDCDSLKEITIPDSVTAIGVCAFDDCANLETVSLSKNLESMGDAAFRKCAKLKSIEIPGTLKSIPNLAFQNCNYLETVTLNDGLETIGPCAFERCNQRLTSIAFPASVEFIGAAAFRDCWCLGVITFDDNIKLDTIKSVTFAGNCFRELYLPASITHIESGAFSIADSTHTMFSKLTIKAQEIEIGSSGCFTDRFYSNAEVIVPCGFKINGESITNDNYQNYFSLNHHEAGSVEPVITFEHDLQKVEKVNATCITAGNTEHWKCSVCSKLFLDSEGENEISQADTVVPADNNAHIYDLDSPDEIEAPTESEDGALIYKCKNAPDNDSHDRIIPIPKDLSYTISDGAYKLGSKKEVAITINCDNEDIDPFIFDFFESLKVNNKKLKLDKDYEAEPGSVKITLNTSYLEKLSAGKYPVEAVFSNDSVKGTLTVTSSSGSSNAKTGDTTPASHIIIAFALFILSLMQVAGTLCGYFMNRNNFAEFAAAQTGTSAAAGTDMTEASAAEADDTFDAEDSAETEGAFGTDDDLADFEDDFVDYMTEEPASKAEQSAE